jgi:hypothetical protein
MEPHTVEMLRRIRSVLGLPAMSYGGNWVMTV